MAGTRRLPSSFASLFSSSPSTSSIPPARRRQIPLPARPIPLYDTMHLRSAGHSVKANSGKNFRPQPDSMERIVALHCGRFPCRFAARSQAGHCRASDDAAGVDGWATRAYDARLIL
jgi:hypothetical protein